MHSTNHLELFCGKNTRKNTRYWTNESIFKDGHHAKAIAFANPHFGSKVKIPKNMSKSILEII